MFRGRDLAELQKKKKKRKTPEKHIYDTLEIQFNTVIFPGKPTSFPEHTQICEIFEKKICCFATATRLSRKASPQKDEQR